MEATWRYLAGGGFVQFFPDEEDEEEEEGSATEMMRRSGSAEMILLEASKPLIWKLLRNPMPSSCTTTRREKTTSMAAWAWVATLCMALVVENSCDMNEDGVTAVFSSTSPFAGTSGVDCLLSKEEGEEGERKQSKRMSGMSGVRKNSPHELSEI